MGKNYYISEACVINLFILYRLLAYGYVSRDEFDISNNKFKRYMANIRYMLDEYHIYHISIVYDPIHKIYRLMGSL